MIALGTGVRVYLACGVTDMRKGIAGLAALAQDVLRQKPSSGAVFAFCSATIKVRIQRQSG
jgi:transposase